MQQSLFGEEEIKPIVKTELIISQKKQKPLNKQQIAFNKFIKKIEKLREELKNTSDDLDTQLAFYGKEIHPLETKANTKRKEIIRILFSQFKKNKKIKEEEKKTLKRFISSLLGDVLSNNNTPPEQDLKDIFKEVTGESYEKAMAEEFEIMKDEMHDMFRESGVDIDLSQLNKDMSQEELAAKMKELSDKMKEQVEEKEHKKSKRKKTAKQLEKEAKNKQLEEVRNKNIKSIYKQLVRALHPDLEQDEVIKAKKHTLMQRLTVAYENNDLHEMLSLEMEFINKEESNIDQLSTDKLAIYNQVLKEQVHALESQKYMLMQHPRLLPLMKYFGLSGESAFDLQEGKERLVTIINSMEASLNKLKGKSVLTEIRETLRHFELSEWMAFEDDDEEENLWEWEDFDEEWE